MKLNSKFVAKSSNNIFNRILILERSFFKSSEVALSLEKGSNSEEIQLPDPPTTCCMSGCANCVWIQYAEELAGIFKDEGEKSKQIILSKVDDPNMKAFLLTELKCLKLKKS